MKVKRIEITNVMSHDHTVLELEDTGVTVLVGDNGHGKSTLTEAVSFAGWSETLRGTSPFRPGVSGKIDVTSDCGHVQSAVTAGGARKISWTPAGSTEVLKGDTPTKTVKMIAAAHGDYDIWKRTHVLSSSDASTFSTATDASRKELVENLIGLTAFDSAYSECNTALSTASATLRLKRTELVGVNHQLETERRVRAENPEPVLTPPTAPVIPATSTLAKLVELEAESEQLIARISAVQVVLDGLCTEVAPTPDPTIAAELRDAEVAQGLALAALVAANVAEKTARTQLQDETIARDLRDAEVGFRLAQDAWQRVCNGACSVCGREWSAESHETAELVYDAAQARFHEVTARQTQALALAGERALEVSRQAESACDLALLRVAKARTVASQQALDIENWQASNRSAIVEKQAEERAMVNIANAIATTTGQIRRDLALQTQYETSRDQAANLFATTHAAWTLRTAKIDERINKLVTQQYTLEDEVGALAADVDELTVCSTVLGPRGVRVQLLAHALAGAESLANLFLATIGSDISLRLLSQSQQANGKIVDTISIEIENAGGGLGYKATSGGERRRIDVALLLAFAEVSAAAHGRQPGTLWIDEVFDALDVEGCLGVAESVMELGRTRNLVVITHRTELAERLRRDGARVFSVVDGQLHPAA